MDDDAELTDEERLNIDLNLQFHMEEEIMAAFGLPPGMLLEAQVYPSCILLEGNRVMTECGLCATKYDDAERSTICPHLLIMPREDLDRKIAALALAEHGGWVRWAHLGTHGEDALMRVESISWNGMLTLAGVPGQYDPRQLVAAKRT